MVLEMMQRFVFEMPFPKWCIVVDRFWKHNIFDRYDEQVRDQLLDDFWENTKHVGMGYILWVLVLIVSFVATTGWVEISGSAVWTTLNLTQKPPCQDIWSWVLLLPPVKWRSSRSSRERGDNFGAALFKSLFSLIVHLNFSSKASFLLYFELISQRMLLSKGEMRHCWLSKNGIRDACSTADIFNGWSSGLPVVYWWSTCGLRVVY